MRESDWSSDVCSSDLFPSHDRSTLQNHLEEAKKRYAKVIVNGDFFCLMQGRGDPRRSKGDIRPEHNNGRYLDSIVDTAVEWFKPYADLILLVGYGNHETSIIQYQETDILLRFATILNHTCKSNVQVLGFSRGHGSRVVCTLRRATAGPWLREPRNLHHPVRNRL